MIIPITHLRKILKSTLESPSRRKAIFSFVFKIFGVLFGYSTFLFLAKTESASVVGTFSLILTVISVVSTLCVFGLDIYILRFISSSLHTTKEEITLVKASVIVSTIILLTISLIIFVLETFDFTEISFLDENFASLIALVLLHNLISILNETMRAHNRVGLYSFINSNSFLLFFMIFSLICSYLKFQIELSLLLLAGYFVSFAIILSSTKFHLKKFNLNLNLGLHDIQFLSRLRSSSPFLLSNSMSFINQWTTIFFISSRLMEEQLGVFTICLKLAMLVRIPVFAINSVTAQKFSYLFYQQKKNQLKKYIAKSSSATLILASMVVAFFYFGAKPLLSIFGTEYAEYIGVFYILLATQYVDVLFGPTGNILRMTGHEKTQNLFMVLSFLCTVSLSIYFHESYDLFTSAIIVFISQIVWNILATAYLYKRLNLVSIPFITYFKSHGD